MAFESNETGDHFAAWTSIVEGHVAMIWLDPRGQVQLCQIDTVISRLPRQIGQARLSSAVVCR